MNVIRLPALVALLGLFMATTGTGARADTVSIGGTYSGQFDMIVNGQVGSYGGGNVGGSSGVSGGNAMTFAAFFCADLFTDANLNTTYSATYNQSGVIGGHAVVAAGQIAWLIDNIARDLTTQAEYQGLQGLIWELESPGVVQFDTNDNSASAVAYYHAYMTALGSNTAPVSDVYWVNPVNGLGQYAYQGFVAATHQQLTAAPEPASLAMLGAGLAGLAGLRRRGQNQA